MRRFLVIFGLLAFLSASIGAEGVSVSCTSEDGVILKGTLFRPKGSAKGGWILLHGLGSMKEEWMPLVNPLVQGGQAVLLMDLRGHGQSMHHEDGNPVDYKQFNTIGPGSPWNAMIGDLKPEVALMKKQAHLDGKRIAVGGASLGANVALNYAADHPEVPALILLSPGLQYAGINAEAAFRQYAPRPVFMAASPGDQYAYGTVQYLARTRGDPALRVASGEGAAHGVQMFNAVFLKKLADWAGTILARPPSK
jgi:alpha-beta hydrolase superfamily lysophospholipase